MSRSCKRAQQFAGVHRLEINDSHAARQREHDVGHLGKRVEERENAEDGVFGADVDHLEDTFGFGFKVAVRQHHALGVAGGARGIQDHRDVVGGDGNGLEGARTCGEDVGEQKGPAVGSWPSMRTSLTGRSLAASRAIGRRWRSQKRSTESESSSSLRTWSA